MNLLRAFATLALASLVVAPTAALAAPAAAPAAAPVVAPVSAVQGSIGPFASGAVVSLKGTPHLWFADDFGTLHWASDTRALANHTVVWASQVTVTLDQLRTLPRGEPWLSAGLVKIGDAIFYARWGTGENAPTLVHLNSITDLELFGIDNTNFNALVLDQATWEKQFSQSAASLARAELAAVTTSSLAASEPWTPFVSKQGGFSIWAPTVATPINPASLPNVPAQALPIDAHVYFFGSYLDGVILAYAVASGSLPKEIADQIDFIGPQAALDQVRNQLASADGVKIDDERRIMVGNNPGREMVIEAVASPGMAASEVPFTDVTLTFRVVLVGKRAYAIAVVKPRAQAGTPDVAKFLDSLRLLSPQPPYQPPSSGSLPVNV